MSDADGETKNIKQYVDEQLTALIGGAPQTADTLKELFGLISSNNTIVDALNSAIANKADKTHNHDTVYAGKAHGHVISEITNVQTTLDGKEVLIKNASEKSSLVDGDNLTTWRIQRILISRYQQLFKQH